MNWWWFNTETLETLLEGLNTPKFRYSRVLRLFRVSSSLLFRQFQGIGSLNTRSWHDKYLNQKCTLFLRFYSVCLVYQSKYSLWEKRYTKKIILIRFRSWTMDLLSYTLSWAIFWFLSDPFANDLLYSISLTFLYFFLSPFWNSFPLRFWALFPGPHFYQNPLWPHFHGPHSFFS